MDSWYDLRFNKILGTVEGRKKDETEYQELNENNLYIRLMTNGYRVTYSNLRSLLNSEYIPVYDPFQSYFESLPVWTETDPDYLEILASHIRAIDQEQFNHHFKKMMVRTIACAIDDRVFNKHAFILVGGEQNTGKSTFCRYLCPPALQQYYAESIPSDKDGQISLCENFMINLDELSTLSKFEINSLKSLFSKDKVRVRHPYARKSQTDPRRVSFIGSTNEDSFLTDTTGSVRWLCFEIRSINWGYRQFPVDPAWSHAYYLYKSGFDYQLTPDEIKVNESRNEQFQQYSTEYEYIQMYLEPGNAFDCDEFWTTTQIRHYIMDRSERRADIKGTDKLGKALRKLGFQRISKRIGNNMEARHGYFVKLLPPDAGYMVTNS